MDAVVSPSENGLSKSSLENIMAFVSYIPVAFAIFFCITSQEGHSQDPLGTAKTIAAVMCIAYAMCAGAASGGGSTDLCKALVLARIVLGVVSFISSVLILALADETGEVIKFVLMYLFLALLTLPEAGIMYLYVRQVQLEKFMAQGGDVHQAPAPIQPGPANYGPPPQSVRGGMGMPGMPYPGAGPPNFTGPSGPCAGNVHGGAW
ncbi:unnamed protein product [Symbiodinium pilosum]|uniref:Uncharacterized protein n=1 Tax=Symbiodinium pilosum TaxID=2952 RepID=A0A812Y0L3_SYMPI|nr:unnamed protein product [Symbiodinium pilosum]